MTWVAGGFNGRCEASGQQNLVVSRCSPGCSGGNVRNEISGQCEAPVQCQGGTIVSGNVCQCPVGQENNDGVCESMACPAGQERDPESGECVWLSNCPAGQQLIKSKSSGGVVTGAACVPEQPAANNQCSTYEQMQTAYCQQQAAECSESGGTYGNVEGNNVCIPAGYAGQLPTCASGSANFVENGDGSNGFACLTAGNGATPPPKVGPNATPEEAAIATQHGIADLGNIMRSGLEGIVNAIKGQGPNGGGDGEGPGEEPGGGEGQCDPKAANYSECIGQLKQAPDADGASLGEKVVTDGSGFLDSAAGALTDAIDSRADAEEPSAIVAAIKAILPQPASCSDVGFSWQGTSFQITCSSTQLYREWAAFALAIAAAFACFQIGLRKE